VTDKASNKLTNGEQSPTLKITPEAHAWVIQEQGRQISQLGRKPSQAELFDMMRKVSIIPDQKNQQELSAPINRPAP